MPKLSPFQIDTIQLGQDPDLQAGVTGNVNLADLGDVTLGLGSPATPQSSQILSWVLSGSPLTGSWQAVDKVDNDVAAVWGNITGDILNQGDLQTTFATKAPTIHTHLEADITDLQSYLLDITAEVIGSLSNVDVALPSTGQVLTFNNVSGNWEATTPAVVITDHTVLTNIGVNTHAQIDTHINGTALQHPATVVTYSDTTTNLQGGGAPITEVQSAIEKLDLKRRYKASTHSGVIAGGLITTVGGSPATFDISDGNGAIIDAVADPTDATGVPVSWTGLSAALSMDASGFGETWVFITSSGTIAQFSTKPISITFITNIFLGVIYYELNAITLITNSPNVIDSTANSFVDYVEFLGSTSNLKGSTPIAIGAGDPSSSLEFFITSGELFSLGISWHSTPYTPNEITVSAVGVDSVGPYPSGTGATFDYILGNGNIPVGRDNQTVLDDTFYDDGTLTGGTVPNGDGLIQFIIRLPGGATYVQPSTTTYRDWKAANSSLQSALSSFVLASPIKSGIIVGAYIGQEGTTSWERGDRASITGFGVGSAGASTAPSSNTFYIDVTTGVGSPLGMLDTSLPIGWSTTYNSIGNFTVTHTLGDTTLGFALAVMYNGTARVINPTSVTTNAVVFQITDTLNTVVEGNVVGKLLF